MTGKRGVGRRRSVHEVPVVVSDERPPAEDLPTRDALERRDYDQDIWHRKKAFDQEIALRRRYASWLLVTMILQLVLANGIFVAHAWVGAHWRLEPAVVQIWLASTVVQVVGVITVVTRHLFPRRDPPEPT